MVVPHYAREDRVVHFVEVDGLDADARVGKPWDQFQVRRRSALFDIFQLPVQDPILEAHWGFRAAEVRAERLEDLE